MWYAHCCGLKRYKMGITIKNLVLFKTGWLACVYFAAGDQAWIGIAAVALVAAAHLLTVPNWRKEALTLAGAALMGFLWESLLVWAQVLNYPTAPGAHTFAPGWIVAMWVLFATTINYGLSWVKYSWWAAALAGAIGGPLAFLGGSAFGAVTFSDTVASLAIIGAGWAVLLPLLALMADTIIDSTRFEPGYRRARRATLLEQAQVLLHSKGLDDG